MNKTKKIDFAKARPTARVTQAEDNGIIKEKKIYTTVNIENDLYFKLKIYVATKNITIGEFFEYHFAKAINGGVPVIGNDTTLLNPKKVTIYIKEALYHSFKIWLANEKITMKQATASFLTDIL